MEYKLESHFEKWDLDVLIETWYPCNLFLNYLNQKSLTWSDAGAATASSLCKLLLVIVFWIYNTRACSVFHHHRVAAVTAESAPRQIDRMQMQELTS
jgi:hypothetical protein